MKKTIALIFGGEGFEHKISEMSAANLYGLIDGSHYGILPIGISKDGYWYIYKGHNDKISNGSWTWDTDNLTPTFPAKMNGASGFITDGGIIPVHCAIPCLHGDFGEDGTVQGALTSAGIAYIGQNVCASSVANDKIYSKLIAEHLGVPTAKWSYTPSDDAKEAKRMAEAKLGYPMFIKPASLGSSYGASPVFSPEDFEACYSAAKRYGSKILVEELIPFEYEIECAMLEDGTMRFSPGGRILSNGKFYDYDSKYRAQSSPKTEAFSGRDREIEEKITEYSASLSSFIGLRYLSRIDFFVTNDKKIYFNEINTFPGMTKTSLYPRLTEDMGIKKNGFINLLLDKVCGYDRRI